MTGAGLSLLVLSKFCNADLVKAGSFAFDGRIIFGGEIDFFVRGDLFEGCTIFFS
jgi:hypothetical protein